MNKSGMDWASNLTPWSNIAETARNLFGECYATYQLATIAAAVNTGEDKCLESDDLFDASRPICRRARRARLRSGSPLWWKVQFENSSNENDRYFAILLFFSWAGPETIKKAAPYADELLSSLDQRSWETLHKAIGQSRIYSSSVSSQDIRIEASESFLHLTNRALLAMSFRCSVASKLEIFHSHTIQKILATSKEPTLGVLCRDMILSLINKNSDWGSAMQLLKQTYPFIKYFKNYRSSFFQHREIASTIPLEIALEVLKNPSKYPCDIVTVAEEKSRERLTISVQPVGKVATDNQWFIQF